MLSKRRPHPPAEEEVTGEADCCDAGREQVQHCALVKGAHCRAGGEEQGRSSAHCALVRGAHCTGSRGVESEAVEWEERDAHFSGGQCGSLMNSN